MKCISFIFLFILFAFTANAQDEPRFAISGDKVVCTLTTTEYTVEYEPPLDNCSKSTPSWDLENAGNATKEVSQDGNSCKVTWDPYSTDAKIKFTANYNGGCDSETVELAVQVGIGNVAKINFPTSVIAGSATPVEFSVTKKQDVAYLWEYDTQNEWRWENAGAAPGDFIDISVNEDANKTVVSPGFNSQNMFVRVQKNNCVDFDIFQQYVAVAPPTSLELVSSTGSFAVPCVSTSPISFSIKNLRDGLPLTYRWRLPNGNWNSDNSTTKTITVQPDGAEPGYLEVEVTMVIDGTTHIIRGSQEITLSANTFTPAMDKNRYLCEMETQSLRALVQQSNGVYYWYSEHGIWINNVEATASNPLITNTPIVNITGSINNGRTDANV